MGVNVAYDDGDGDLYVQRITPDTFAQFKQDHRSKLCAALIFYRVEKKTDGSAEIRPESAERSI